MGVQQAQEFGIRVHLVGIKGPEGNQSHLLLQEADEVHQLSEENVRTFLTVRTEDVDRAIEVDEADHVTSLPARVAQGVWNSLTDTERDGLRAASSEDGRSIPREIDRLLLKTMSDKHKRELVFEEKKAVREAFKAILCSSGN